MAKKDLIPRPFLADSTNINSYGYDTAKRMLAIEFKNGAIFQYRNVDGHLFAALQAAESKGSFYSKQVKGKFPAERMTGICPNCKITGIIDERCDCGDTFVEVETGRKVPPDVEVDPLDQVRR